MARRKNSNEAIESVEPTDIEMDVENEEYDSQENVNEEAEINTKIESTQSSESETEPAENSESENSDSDENPDNSADSVEPENIENVNETENGDNPVEKFLDKLNPKMRAKIFGMLVILQEKQLAKARRADYMERMKKL